jgi:hypothetical protein
VDLFAKPPVKRRADGRFALAIPEQEREVLRGFLEQLRDLLMGEDPLLTRLFPPAYLSDEKRDAEYQQLMRGDLLESRFSAIERTQATLDEKVVDENTLTGWLQSINALRLVVGTRLDAGEEPRAPDPDDPDLALHVLYDHLGWLVAHIVRALSEALPPPNDEITL